MLVRLVEGIVVPRPELLVGTDGLLVEVPTTSVVPVPELVGVPIVIEDDVAIQEPPT